MYAYYTIYVQLHVISSESIHTLSLLNRLLYWKATDKVSLSFQTLVFEYRFQIRLSFFILAQIFRPLGKGGDSAKLDKTKQIWLSRYSWVSFLQWYFCPGFLQTPIKAWQWYHWRKKRKQKKVQSNPQAVNTDTEGGIESVCINRVFVLKVVEHSFGSLWVYVICKIMTRERLQLTSWTLASEKYTDEGFWLTSKMLCFRRFHGNMNDWIQP